MEWNGMLQLTTCKWVEKGIYYVIPKFRFKNISTIMGVGHYMKIAT